MEKCEIKDMENRIKELEERMSMNQYDIDFGEANDFKRYSRIDNTFCRGRIKEIKRKLSLTKPIIFWILWDNLYRFH